MKFREFSMAICDACGEKYSHKKGREILQETTDDIGFHDDLNDIPDGTFNGMLRKDRNLTADMASDVKSYYQRDLLKEYLSDICETKGVDQLCQAFQQYCPDITKDNAIECVADLFEKMVDDASQGKRSATEETVSLSPEDRRKLLRILKGLRSKTDYFIECITMAVEGKTYMLNEFELEDDYDKFIKLNYKLRDFNVLHPELTTLKKVFDLCRSIHPQNYHIEGNEMILDPGLREYMNALDAVYNELCS
jgi:hypothetical protein